MKFSELITKLHSASQPHMLMYIDIRSDCELADVNILASGQSDVQAGTLYFADAGQLTPDTVLPTNLLYYGTLPPELADRLTNSAMIDRGEFAVLFQTVKELLSYQQSDQQLYTQVLYMLLCPADVDYHIDFICAVFNCLLCLCNLDWSGGISEGKANYGAYIDILIFVVNVIYKACRNAYRCSAVFQRLLCNGFNLLCCAKRLEERMVNVSVYFFFLQCYISFQLL